MKKILFVCTANICRSPMLEGLAKQLISRKKLSWVAISGGTWGQDGLPAAANAIEVMKTRRIDLRRHRSRIINRKTISQADLVLTMEANQKEALQIEFPEFKSRILMLSELIEEQYDIEDPMGKSIEDFERTAREMEMILVLGIEKIQRIFSSKN